MFDQEFVFKMAYFGVEGFFGLFLKVEDLKVNFSLLITDEEM